MAHETKRLPYEENAERKTIEVWACKTCGRSYEVKPGPYGESNPEHHARWCCAESLPCRTDLCAGRVRKPYYLCDGCREKAEAKRWEERLKTAKPWDGESPLFSDATDKFYTGSDVLDGYPEEDLDEGQTLADLRLVHANADPGPRRELSDLWEDHLPDDYDGVPDEEGLAEVQKAWEAYLDGCLPLTWYASSTPVLLDSEGRIVREKTGNTVKAPQEGA